MSAVAGVGLLTTSGADPNIGDALCIGSAALFGVHKWRSEAATARHNDHTSELIAVQLLVLASASALYCTPELLSQLSQGPGARPAGAIPSLLGFHCSKTSQPVVHALPMWRVAIVPFTACKPVWPNHACSLDQFTCTLACRFFHIRRCISSQKGDIVDSLLLSSSSTTPMYDYLHLASNIQDTKEDFRERLNHFIGMHGQSTY